MHYVVKLRVSVVCVLFQTELSNIFGEDCSELATNKLFSPSIADCTHLDVVLRHDSRDWYSLTL